MTRKARPSNNPDQEFDHMFFGRRFGRPLKKGRKDALEHILPKMQITHENLASTLDKVSAALPQSPLWVEVGFGTGEHFVELVRHHPDKQFIGCEPFINGVAQCLKYFEQRFEDADDREDYTQSTYIWTDPAEILLDSLPDNSVERFYLLNPDPWPKSRHHKRRFVRKENLDRIARVLKPGGVFITATDVSELAEWMLEHTLNHGQFAWNAKSSADWQDRPKDWMITTRYAEKGVEAGRQELYFHFTRK